MFYRFFRGFSIFCAVFGLYKPFIIKKEHKLSISSWSSIWSLVVAASLVTLSVFQISVNNNSVMDSINDEISYCNNIVVNVIIILNNITNWEKNYRMYELFDQIICELKLRIITLKMMTLKLYMMFLVEVVILLIFAVLEFIYDVPPYVVIIQIPVFLSIFHLIVHTCLMLSILKIVNLNMLEILKKNSTDDIAIYEYQTSEGSISYILNYNIYFAHVESGAGIDLKILCKIYDDLCTGLQLLEKCHGVEVLLTIWLMLTNGVAAATLISKKETTEPWLEIIKALETMIWFCVGCFIDEQMRQEVEYTQLLVIKNLINFRCDKTKKEILKTFNTVINSNRLQFRACNLYRMNYATVLGTVVSVITYSIVAVQLL